MERKYKVNNNLYDEYYTKENIAKKCILLYKEQFPNVIKFLEPSAGKGSFSNQLENCIAIDIKPNGANIIKFNFFDISIDFLNRYDLKLRNFTIIGNPPFGRNSSIAIRFFNHSCLFCNHIAFILPKTFRKLSVQNKLNDNFHLVFDFDLPKNSFIHNNIEVNVPTVFQIWEFREYKRDIIKPSNTTDLFSFVDKNNADVAIRRVGGNSGKIYFEINSLSPQSNYFIKMNKLSLNEFINIIKNINFSEVINNTVGVRSLSKGELISLIERIYNGNK